MSDQPTLDLDWIEWDHTAEIWDAIADREAGSYDDASRLQTDADQAGCLSVLYLADYGTAYLLLGEPQD